MKRGLSVNTQNYAKTRSYSPNIVFNVHDKSDILYLTLWIIYSRMIYVELCIILSNFS